MKLSFIALLWGDNFDLRNVVFSTKCKSKQNGGNEDS